MGRTLKASKSCSIVWFRQDLRLADNPALAAAVERGQPIVPVYIWAPEDEGGWPPGAASRWWLHHSLHSLNNSLEKKGTRLMIRRGPALATLQKLIVETGADAIYFNRRYEPAARLVESKLNFQRDALGITSHDFNSALLFEPDSITTSEGKPYRVFTPFYRTCLSQQEPPVPFPAPRAIPRPSRWPHSESLDALDLLPKIDWAVGLQETWAPGEKGAASRLKQFLMHGLASYPALRDRPDTDGVSKLSPHLHFGEISPWRVWHAVQTAMRESNNNKSNEGASVYLRQLIWREFAHHLLYHFPHTADAPLHREYLDFPWRKNRPGLKKWQQGSTGYPIVDAGMRQLWRTGWMHNRVRMIAASFLVKDLLIPWTEGARWFWDTLVDADLANNTLGWQWTAGCGADAAPYFRIFNPVSQGEKFDPEGNYVRTWVPELSRLDTRWIQKPWAAPKDVVESSGIFPGKSYPRPMVDHGMARQRALEAYAKMRGKSKT